MPRQHKHQTLETPRNTRTTFSHANLQHCTKHKHNSLTLENSKNHPHSQTTKRPQNRHILPSHSPTVPHCQITRKSTPSLHNLQLHTTTTPTRLPQTTLHNNSTTHYKQHNHNRLQSKQTTTQNTRNSSRHVQSL